MSDVFEYHAHCSLVGGLEETAQAVERASNPGSAEALQLLAGLSQQYAIVRQIKLGMPVSAVEAANAQLGVQSKLDQRRAIEAEAKTALDHARTALSDANKAEADYQPGASSGDVAQDKVDDTKARRALADATKKEQDHVADLNGTLAQAQKNFEAALAETINGADMRNDKRMIEDPVLRCPFASPQGLLDDRSSANGR